MAERTRQHREMRVKSNEELRNKVSELKAKLKDEEDRIRRDFEEKVQERAPEARFAGDKRAYRTYPCAWSRAERMIPTVKSYALGRRGRLVPSTFVLGSISRDTLLPCHHCYGTYTFSEAAKDYGSIMTYCMWKCSGPTRVRLMHILDMLDSAWYLFPTSAGGRGLLLPMPTR